jgi:threonyl-tRNA synthetase
MSPIQAVVLPIAPEFDNYAKKIFDQLTKAGINSEVDLKNQKINFKIREHSLAKTPLLLICGQKEKKDNSITIRRLGSEKQQTLKVSKLISEISKKINLPSKNLN